MIRSLLIKLAMLALTIGAVFWIGWRTPQVSVKTPVASAQSEPLPAPAAVAPDEKKKAVVPLSGEPAPSQPLAPAKAVQRDGGNRRALVDLNRASVEDLESLPGLGSVLARRVVAHRQAVGKFQSVEDLRQVKGIGPKTLNRVRASVTVSAPGGRGISEKPPS